MRKGMLAQILDPDARERRTRTCGAHSEHTHAAHAHGRCGMRVAVRARRAVSRIAVVKPDRARGVEELLLRMARSGQLQGRVTEPQLIQFLEQISGQEKKAETKITVRAHTHARRPAHAARADRVCGV